VLPDLVQFSAGVVQEDRKGHDAENDEPAAGAATFPVDHVEEAPEHVFKLTDVATQNPRVAGMTALVQPVIALEREPSDASWLTLCDGLGVLVVWPPDFDQLRATQKGM
jgi:hypothetical protein